MESLVKRLIDRLCRVQRLGTLLLDPGGEIFTAGQVAEYGSRHRWGASGSADCDLSRPEDLHLPTVCLGRRSSDCDSVLKQSTDEKWGLQPLLETVCIDALADQRDPTLGDEASWRSARR